MTEEGAGKELGLADKGKDKRQEWVREREAGTGFMEALLRGDGSGVVMGGRCMGGQNESVPDFFGYVWVCVDV